MNRDRGVELGERQRRTVKIGPLHGLAYRVVGSPNAAVVPEIQTYFT